MYGECIALSFCGGRHVSHDRRLVWEGGGQKGSGFRPEGPHSIKETLVVNSLPQVRCVISVKRIKLGLICGAVSSPPVQEIRLNWWGLEIVK